MDIILSQEAAIIIVASHYAVRNILRELSRYFIKCLKNINIFFVFLKFSLKRLKKNNSRRVNKNNQQISIITSENTGGAGGLNNVIPQTQQQQYHDNRMNTQVKTYTDHGNGHSVMRTGNYSKVIDIYKFIYSVTSRFCHKCISSHAKNENEDLNSSFDSMSILSSLTSNDESLNEYIRTMILNNISDDF